MARAAWMRAMLVVGALAGGVAGLHLIVLWAAAAGAPGPPPSASRVYRELGAMLKDFITRGGLQW